jgi:predicted adenine nucleotide alpha hydrolase (AANH) superfamily ATPase
MKLLIHTCCADCALHLIDSFESGYIDSSDEVAFYFYNPNIHPQEEYYARLRALKLVFKDKPYKLIFPHWSPKEYFGEIRKLIDRDMDVNDRKVRCPRCWTLRLGNTFKYAKENGYEAVTTTMLTSDYMDTERIVVIGNELAAKIGVDFLVPKNAKCDLKTKGFYKQNYCGCIYSLKARLEEKFLS